MSFSNSNCIRSRTRLALLDGINTIGHRQSRFWISREGDAEGSTFRLQKAQKSPRGTKNWTQSEEAWTHFPLVDCTSLQRTAGTDRRGCPLRHGYGGQSWPLHVLRADLGCINADDLTDCSIVNCAHFDEICLLVHTELICQILFQYISIHRKCRNAATVW